MEDSISINLGGKDYTIKPLTVGQLEALHIGVLDLPPPDPKEAVTSYWSKQRALLAAALSEDHPELTEDAIKKLRLGSIKAVNEAVSKVLAFAGLAATPEQEAPKGDAATGEARAAAE